jgi:hypothetical protein
MKAVNRSGGRFPGKSTMNFVRREKKFRPRVMLPLILVLVAAAFAIAKFAFIDPLTSKAEAYGKLSARREELAAATTAAKDYDSVAEKYAEYSYGGMTSAETALPDRVKAISLVESKIASAASVSSFSISGSTLTVDFSGVTLEQTSAIVKDLESSELVSSVFVQTAWSDAETAAAGAARKASFSMTVALAESGEGSSK